MLKAKRDSQQSPDAPRSKHLATPPAKKPVKKKSPTKPAKKVAVKSQSSQSKPKEEKKTRRRGI